MVVAVAALAPPVAAAAVVAAAAAAVAAVQSRCCLASPHHCSTVPGRTRYDQSCRNSRGSGLVGAMSEPTRVTSLETCNNSDGEDTESHWPLTRPYNNSEGKKAHLSVRPLSECQRQTIKLQWISVLQLPS